MICKYCGAQYTGNRCTSCGQVIPLVKRSTNLDKLMAVQPEADSSKDIQKAEREGYRKGLKEGFSNGLKEGIEKGRREGLGQALEEGHTNREGQKKAWWMNPKRLTALCAAFLVLLAADGLIFRTAGFRAGEKSAADKYESRMEEQYRLGRYAGYTEAEDFYKPQLDEHYQSGHKDGYTQAEELYKPQLEERYQSGRTDGYREAENIYSDRLKEQFSVGYKQGKEDAENQYGLALDDLVALAVLNFPYSTQNAKVWNPVVQKIQMRLGELGYKGNGKVIKFDGYYGNGTQNAVRFFQKDQKVRTTGKVDEETYYLLFPEEKLDFIDTEEETPINDVSSDEDVVSESSSPEEETADSDEDSLDEAPAAEPEADEEDSDALPEIPLPEEVIETHI